MLIQLNGLSADLPFPGAATVAAGSAATKSLTRTLAAELGPEGPRVHELVLGVVRTRQRGQAGRRRPVDRPAGDRRPRRRVGGGTSPLSDTVLQYFTDSSGPRPGAAS